MCYKYSIKIPAGIDRDQVLAAVRGRAEACDDHAEPRIDCGNRPSEASVERAIQRLSATVAGTATDRQVAYIMSLLADHEGGGYLSGPTTREGVAAMTRREASAYIDSLTGRY